MGLKSALNSAEIFDPTTGQFTLTRGRMHTKRDDLSACLLEDGTVLIAGGYNNQTELIRSLEIFHPASGRFKTFEELADISVFNLVGAKTAESCWLEKRRAWSFSSRPAKRLSTAAGRKHEARTVLGDPAGGRESAIRWWAGDNRDRVLNSVELFDPASRTFSSCKHGLSGPPVCIYDSQDLHRAR